ncbi:hypothetical protein [Aeromonas salmonicida]|uniref:hypothetical protein n=1 Tax=Aeromonas salmonicida TaxID=645 RepID=UPI003CEB9F3E
MDGSLNEITEAIRGLYSNPVKDYIFPTISALSSAALGAWAAFYAVNTQERNRIHVQNVDSINDATLKANEAKNSLMAIKSNYHNELSSDPYQRLISIPRILIDEPPIVLKISTLVFLTPSEVGHIYSKWQRIEYIDTLFKNYNQVVCIWKKRNELLNEMMLKLNQFHAQTISSDILLQLCGLAKVCEISDLTEQAILLTDELLVELSCFLIGFPEVAKNSVPNKIRKKFRKIIVVCLPKDESAVDLLSMSPMLDYDMAAVLHTSSVQEIKHRYRSIYLK